MVGELRDTGPGGEAELGHQLLQDISNHDEGWGITTFGTMIGGNAYRQEWVASGYAAGALWSVPKSVLVIVPRPRRANWFPCQK
ncbi:hypothetical protein [Corynebacterium sp. A21]|uniref:hypothetical protein n=1 Tax=Corynebacterium sp. A21 TaxID=3457318 RepID=UPI003FD22F11